MYPKYLVYAYACATGTFFPLSCITTTGYGPSGFSVFGLSPLNRNVFE